MSSAALLTRPATDRAFEKLYRKHVHDVYRYVLAVLRNPADAEDATQATFLSAYRAFQRGDRPELPRNWLLKIAHNECRQRFRMLARRPKEVVWDERVAAPAIDETVPTADELRQALSHLSFNQRSALVMRELEGRSYNEIGEILDVSVSAVETLIFRARRALREQLEGGLTCGEAEATLSKRLDGTLAAGEQRALRAHLRECRECAALERKQRAQRAALKRLGIVQLPPSLIGFLGGGGSAGTVGGVVAGSGLAAKAAAVVAAGAVAGGVGHEAVEAVAAREPARAPLPAIRHVPKSFPASYGTTSNVWAGRGTIDTANRIAAGVSAGPRRPSTSRMRKAVGRSLARPRAGAPAAGGTASAASPTAPTSPGSPPSAGAPPTGGVTAPQPPSPPQPVQQAVETAQEVVKAVPLPQLPPVVTPPASPPPPPPVQLPKLPPIPPLPPLPPPPPILP
jgi:RNA polymerase sigma factor (sigma-70 family)